MAMDAPTPRQWRALARSSPYRWRTLVCTVTWRGWPGDRQQPVRAWVRRPDALRVETLDGRLVQRSWVTRLSDVAVRPLAANAPPPRLDADGLVAQRPDDFAVDFDDPMFRDYHWVAMLDPYELADGPRRTAERDAVELDSLGAVRHHGRPAWEAVVRPTAHYDPRCSCCPLLYSAQSDAHEVEAGAPPPDPTPVYADAHRVVLDVQTAVCVLSEELGGDRAGRGHDVAVESVDEVLPDHLFGPHRVERDRSRGFLTRRRGRFGR